MRAFLRDALLLLPVAGGVFLVGADFFRAYDGTLVSVAPPRGDDDVRQVRLLIDDRVRQRWWSADAVDGLDLPVDPNAAAPVAVPAGRPSVHKDRFTLVVTASAPDGDRIVPTTTRGLLGLALGAWLSALAVRNMVVGGAPWRVAPPQDAARTITAEPMVPRKRARDVTRPPPRPRRGAGRR
ncbi:MAG: hypothetical protein H6738_23505 [Alphaproteobacteria bacterium]|nr:hypothetical protein [Alphaproteobacteria bacterium]